LCHFFDWFFAVLILIIPSGLNGCAAVNPGQTGDSSKSPHAINAFYAFCLPSVVWRFYKRQRDTCCRHFWRDDA
jgi:hypothetical protein